MDTKQATRLKETYRQALANGLVARYRERFRDGGVFRSVLLYLEPTPFVLDEPASPYLPDVGNFQLRYHPKGSGTWPMYGVYGRIDGQDEWILVEGPWPVDNGPFDSERAKERYRRAQTRGAG